MTVGIKVSLTAIGWLQRLFLYFCCCCC